MSFVLNKKNTKFQVELRIAETALKTTNQKIGELGECASVMYETINRLQLLFDLIRNFPSEKRLKYEALKKITLNWKQQAEKIESDYKNTVAKAAGGGAAGIGMGVAVAALGPSVAMGVATTFGIASTGVAISSLSGAAATNAALAWLGGGSLIAGGNGIAGGTAFLALAGPLGHVIAAVALLASGAFFLKNKNDKERLQNIYTLIAKRDTKSYESATVELNERIQRVKTESEALEEAIDTVQTFGYDYSQMTEEQQYTLGAYLNLMESSTQLLTMPIVGLQPKYTEEDYQSFVSQTEHEITHKKLIIFFANLFYNITVDDDSMQLLWKSLKHNKKLLESLGIEKEKFEYQIIENTFLALKHKYAQ